MQAYPTTSMLLAVVTQGVALVVLAGATGWLPTLRGGGGDPGLVAARITGGLGLQVLLACFGYAYSPWLGDFLPLAVGIGGWAKWMHGWRRDAQRSGARTLAQQARITANRLVPLHVAVLLALLGVALAALAVHRPVPPGFDPSFHAILAEQVRLSGTLPLTWQPFDPVAVNYPFGMHVGLGWLARWTGVEGGVAFRVMQAWGAWWHVLLVAALAARLTRSRSGTLGTLLAYLGLGVYGTVLNYEMWGGLPTVLALNLFFATLLVALHPLARSDRRAAPILVGVCLAALLLVHHLTALIVAALLGANLVVHLLRRQWPAVRLWLAAVAVQLLLAAPYLAWYIPKARDLAQTSALRFGDEPMFTWHAVGASLGWWLLPLALLGLAVRHRQGHGWRGVGGQLLAIWLAVPTLLFVALDRGYRAWLVAHEGINATAFTPSRLLTVLAYPLALLAGVAVAWTCGRTPNRLARRALALGVAALALVLFALRYGERWRASSPVNDARLAMYRAIHANTPPDAFVLYTLPAARAETNWQSYLAWRATMFTPLPASEPVGDPRIQMKGAFLHSGQIADLLPVLRDRQRSLYIVAPAGRALAIPGAEQVAAQDDWVLYRIANAAYGDTSMP